MAVSIAFEGLEGAGKGTQAVLLELLLKKTSNFPVLSVPEPGGTELGLAIRHILLGGERFRDMDPRSRTLIYTADRNELLMKRILPFMQENPSGIVVGDRCWASTLALQSSDGDEIEYIRSVQAPFMSVYPDKIVYIDIPPEETLVRIYSAKQFDREINWRDKQTKEKFAHEREGYLRLIRQFRERFFVMDGYSGPWDIAFQTRSLILGELAKDPRFREDANSAIEGFSRRDLAEIVGSEQLSGRVGFEGLLNAQEAVRKELGIEDREVLRARMHEEWISLGIERFAIRRERS